MNLGMLDVIQSVNRGETDFKLSWFIFHVNHGETNIMNEPDHCDLFNKS